MSVSTASRRPSGALVPAGTWKVDPIHSSVEFQVKHMMIATVKGRFTAFEGTLEAGENGRLEARGTVRVNSIDTHESKRDEHLRSPDFFDAATHPQIRFSSTEIAPTGDSSLRIASELTIKGHTQPVELAGEVGGVGVDPWGNDRVGLMARGEINRRDFGLTWNQAVEAGGALVSDKVRIEIDISAVRVTDRLPAASTRTPILRKLRRMSVTIDRPRPR
jgi:polyisoprenoid-binding protein YceI